MGDVPTMIREARLASGLTQHELARRASTSQSALARYESGVALPTLPTLERVLSACGRRLQLRSLPADAGRASAPVSSVLGQSGPQARALRVNRRALLDAARSHGVLRVSVFGSLARGQATATSDIDLLVEIAPERTLLDLAGFRREASEILGLEVDVATADMLKGHIRETAIAEALPL